MLLCGILDKHRPTGFSMWFSWLLRCVCGVVVPYIDCTLLQKFLHSAHMLLSLLLRCCYDVVVPHADCTLLQKYLYSAHMGSLPVLWYVLLIL